MSLSHVVAVWVTSPDALQRLDLTDAASVYTNTHMTDAGLSMEECGWVKIGTAVLTYGELLSRADVVKPMCNKIDEALAKIEATTYQKVMELKSQKNNLLALEFDSND